MALLLEAVRSGRPYCVRRYPPPMPIGSVLGRAVARTEDPRFLTGGARYCEDLAVDGALHAVFVRASFVRHIDMPLTPERTWRAIHGAARRSGGG